MRAAELVVVIGHRNDLVAAAREVFQHRRRETRLDADFQALHDAVARPVARRLRILAVVGDAHHHLGVALRLHRAPHDAEAHHRLAVLRDEAGDDRLVRAFARADAIGMAARHHESPAPVLHRDAVHYHARAESHVVGLDERHHHAGSIRRREVDGAALGGRAVAEVLRALHVDERGARFEVARPQQLLRPHVHVVEIAHVAARIGESELHRLDLQVQAVGAVDLERRDIEVLQDAERGQRDDPLAVGRQLMQRVAAVVDCERRDPVRAVSCQVRGAHRTAVLFGVRLDFFGQRSPVERLAPGSRNLLESLRMLGKTKALAGPRCPAARHEGFGEPGLRFQLGHLLLPLAGDGGRDEEPFSAVPDCPVKELFERQLAEFAMQLQPRRYAARNSDGIPAARRHRFLAAEELGRPAGRRAAGRIEAMQLPAVPDDGVGVGADAVGHRLDQREGNGGGEGGVDRRAAGGEHLQPGLRGERLRGGHGIFGEHRPARPGVGIVPGKGRHGSRTGAGAVLTDPKSSTTRPSTFPPFRSSSARLA